MREEGHVYFGEAFIVARTSHDIARNFADLLSKAKHSRSDGEPDGQPNG